MKRSSSKLISKAGSMRNINKVGFKFRFELQIESLDKLISANEVVLTWQRGAKIVATPPVPVDKSRVANFGNAALSQDVTLFKKKKEGADFADKVYKLVARAGSESGKVVGKIEINFADYVEIPSFSKRVSAAMSHGGKLILRVSSTFIGEAKARKGSRGTSSVGTMDMDSDAGSMLDAEEASRDQLSAFDDISIDDDLASNNMSAPAPSPAQPNPPFAHTASNPSHSAPSNAQPAYNAAPAPPHAQPAAQQPAPSRRPSATRRSSDHDASILTARPTHRRQASSPRGADERAASPTMRTRPPAHRIDSDLGVTSGGGGSGAPSRAEFERMGKEARALRRANDDLVARNAELERRLDSGGGGYGGAMGDADEVDRLARENKNLRRANEDLDSQLKREPVYSDVVRDLREAKMALAILTLEKDELMQEIRRLRR